jgi:uncharacterized protein YodC (DUF2158 family)
MIKPGTVVKLRSGDYRMIISDTNYGVTKYSTVDQFGKVQADWYNSIDDLMHFGPYYDATVIGEMNRFLIR